MPDGTDATIASRRWRRWSAAEKLRIVAESQAPEGGVNIVAARYNVSASLVSTWRRQVREGLLQPAASTGFVAVCLPATVPPSAAAEPAGRDQTDAAAIEIALPDGTHLFISHAAQLPLLRGVLAALRA